MKRKFKYEFGRGVQIARPYGSDFGDYDHFRIPDTYEFMMRNLRRQDGFNGHFESTQVQGRSAQGQAR